MDPFLAIGILSLVATVVVAIAGWIWRAVRGDGGEDAGPPDPQPVGTPVLWCDDTRSPRGAYITVRSLAHGAEVRTPRRSKRRARKCGVDSESD